MKRQSGVALVFAILVLGVVVAVATRLADEFFLSLRRTGNETLGRQAREYLLSAEQLAMLRLGADEDAASDHLSEAWALPEFGLEVDGGWIHCTLEDLQGRYNLNTLRDVRGKSNLSDPAPATEPERRLIRLLEAVGGERVDEPKSVELAEQLIDWLDANDEATGFGGAESAYFSDLAIPARAANRAMHSVSELRMLPAMTPELFDVLQPYLTTWPASGAAVNVNTASRELLAAIIETEDFRPDPSTLADLMAAREERGFGSLQAFAAATGRRGGTALTGLSLRSDWFLLKAEVLHGGVYWHMESVLQREGRKVLVRARSFGGL